MSSHAKLIALVAAAENMCRTAIVDDDFPEARHKFDSALMDARKHIDTPELTTVKNDAHRALFSALADVKRAAAPPSSVDAIIAMSNAIHAACEEHGVALESLQSRDYAKFSMFDLVGHLYRQRDWSLATFGPGDRRKGITDHIRKELVEIGNNPRDVEEWIDVVKLALDGAWRAGHEPEAIAAALENKQLKNEGRTWPDWRTQDADKAIEHDRSVDPQEAPPEPEDRGGELEEPETVLMVFQGYSDDTFGEYGTQNVDFCDNGSGRPIEWLITSPNSDEQLLVVGQYGTGSATGWVVGVAPWDPNGDDETMPDWPISIEQSERAYSPSLFVSAPKGSTLRCLQEPVQKNTDFFES